MSVTADACNSFEAEIEELGVEAGFLQEGDEERSETAVNVKRDLALQSKSGERGNIIDDTMREVGR